MYLLTYREVFMDVFMLKCFEYFSFNPETYQNLGQVIQIIQVNRVTLCPDQVGLTQFYKLSGSDPDSALDDMH